MRFALVGFLSVCLLVAGCGGTSSSAISTPVDSGQPFAFGELSGRAAISNPPVTTTSNNVTATGLTGAFTILKQRDLATNLAATRIVFSNAYTQLEIASCAADGSDYRRLTNNNATDFLPSVSSTGKIAFSSNRDGAMQIYTMNLDGSNVKRITNFPSTDVLPQWSPDGTKIAYISDRSGSEQIWIVNPATLQTTQVTNGNFSALHSLCFSYDGQWIYFSDTATIFQVAPNGGGLNAIALATDFVRSLAASPDGQELAYAQDSVSSPYVIRMSIGEPSNQLFVYTPGPVDSVAYSPDGRKLVASVFDGPPTSSGTNIYTTNLDGSSIAAITNTPTSKLSPSWGPITRDRTLIASAGGILGTSAAGIIYSQRGTSTTSCVTFQATTPSSVVITQQTGLNSVAPNLVFSVDADNIPQMAFANGNNWVGQRIIGSGTPVGGASGALVSIDATTGFVVGILPFSGSRSISDRPTVSDDGTMRTFSGHFIAVFDGSGRNLAPTGANRVRMDTRTNVMTVG